MAKCLLTQGTWSTKRERKIMNGGPRYALIGGRTEDLVTMDPNTERHIGETMAEVLRERLVELETLEATGAATEETVGRLAFVRKLLIRFDARDTSTATRPA